MVRKGADLAASKLAVEASIASLWGAVETDAMQRLS